MRLRLARLLPVALPALLLAGVGACTGAETGGALLRARPQATDSLVLRLPKGRGVYYTAPRTATSVSGEPCMEFSLEIRDTSGRKQLVPLLYTRDRPVADGDSAFVARLWSRCEAGPSHRVSLVTGLPVRIDR